MVVSTAGVLTVQSATKEDGLVNQAFKITILVGLALSLAVGIFLLYKLTGVLGEIADAITLFSGVSKVFTQVGPLAPLTFFFSTFFGRSGK